MTMHLSPTDEQQLIRSAQEGDEVAFRSLVEQRRAELHAHCYRILASADDADDAVQDTLLRAWRALPRFELRSSLRTWLFKIASNAALDIAGRRTRRELPIEFGPPSVSGQPLGEPVTEIAWIGPYAVPDATWQSHPDSRYGTRESIELAYVAALQHLPAHQRTVFILREVLGFRAAETAEILDTTVAAVNSSLQRARAGLSGRMPKISQAVELHSVGDVAIAELAARYASAIEEADIDALLSLLTDDVSWSMPPITSWYRGREEVAEFLVGYVFRERWRHLTTRANGQLAIAGYMFDSKEERFLPGALDLLELREGRVAAVTGFLTYAAATPVERETHTVPWRLFDRFGLPDSLPTCPQ
jgi:RNA polymerase sigma-70 factor, ECF subfamily